MDSLAQLLPRVAIGACVLGLICVYILYYILFNVKRPRVICCDAQRLRALERHCPALFELYWPTFWAMQGHIQSIVRLLTQQAPSVESFEGRRDTLDMSDGGHVCLDWFNEKSVSERDDDPIVLILTGMTGSSKETYVRHWIDDCNRLGYRSVVFNYRGCGNSKLSTPKMFSLGDVADLMEVGEHIHSLNPSSRVVAVGVSMAGIQLIRYVAECTRLGKPCRISAILLFSIVWDLTKTDKSLHSNFFNRHILSRFLTRRYTNIMKENRVVFERKRNELPFDYEEAIQSRNLRELNRACVVPMFGYHGDPKQHSHSPCENVGLINVPLIAVNAGDDPFSPAEALPEGVARGNRDLILVTTRRGGHMGFLQGLFPFHKTYMNTVLSQFLPAVLEHDCFSMATTAEDSNSVCDPTELETHALL